MFYDLYGKTHYFDWAMFNGTKPLLSSCGCPIHQGPGEIEDIQVPRDGRVVAAEAQGVGLGTSAGSIHGFYGKP